MNVSTIRAAPAVDLRARLGEPSPPPRWPLPATASLLQSGGDERITSLPTTGLNKYGCPLFEDPTLLSFASATASSLSPRCRQAVDALRTRIAGALERQTAADIHAVEAARLREELLGLLGLGARGDVEVVVAASGTDLHLVASRQVLGAVPERRRRIIMVDPGETGSGARAALAGRHFARSTALGRQVPPDGEVDDTSRVEVASVALRHADGRARACADVDDDVEALVAQAMRQGDAVLLVLADQSRTGILAPSPARALEWHAQYADRLTVMVDACQCRLAPETLRAYLGQGWLVAVTGSKFLGGAPFSGALLVPGACASFARTPARALAAYVARGDWPARWRQRGVLRHVHNLGLLLRWELGLHGLRALQACRADDVGDFVALFAHDVSHRLASMKTLRAMSAPSFARSSSAAGARWDAHPTIFSFVLLHPVTGRPLGAPQTLAVQRELARDSSTGLAPAGPGAAAARLRCRFAQAVPMGEHDGAPVQALRLCLGAVDVAEALASPRGGDAVRARAHLALDKLAWTVGQLAR